jgi:Nuclease A inhibitor-like protein
MIFFFKRDYFSKFYAIIDRLSLISTIILTFISYCVVMTTKSADASLLNEKISLKDEIISLSSDLMYPSESDEKIEYFQMEFSTEDKLSLANFRMYNGIRPEIEIEEMDFELFFKSLIKIEDWFGEDEKKWAEDSMNLKQLLTEKLKEIRILKVGKIEIDVYLFGKSEECKWEGLKTKLIET